MTTEPMTEAEQAAAEAMVAVADHPEWMVPADFAPEARAVVAAVRPAIYDEIAAEIEQSPMFSNQTQRAAMAHLFRNVAEGQRRALRTTTSEEN